MRENLSKRYNRITIVIRLNFYYGHNADIKSHVNVQFLEPKCFCVHPLEAQRQSEEYNETLVQIVCETNFGLEPSGGCGRDEYCAGLNTLDDAVCGKINLCTKKGNIYVDLV